MGVLTLHPCLLGGVIVDLLGYKVREQAVNRLEFVDSNVKAGILLCFAWVGCPDVVALIKRQAGIVEISDVPAL